MWFFLLPRSLTQPKTTKNQVGPAMAKKKPFFSGLIQVVRHRLHDFEQFREEITNRSVP